MSPDQEKMFRGMEAVHKAGVSLCSREHAQHLMDCYERATVRVESAHGFRPDAETCGAVGFLLGMQAALTSVLAMVSDDDEERLRGELDELLGHVADMLTGPDPRRKQ